MRIVTVAPRNIDAFIVDGMFLYSLMLICLQLLEGANVTLSHPVRHANHVDFACETFKSPSINDINRDHGLV